MRTLLIPVFALALSLTACTGSEGTPAGPEKVHQPQTELGLEAWGITQRCTAELGAEEILLATPSDCSYDYTNILSEYDPQSGVVFEIPVVFHMIESSSGEGHVADQEIFEQIDILNEDFRAITGTPGGPGTDGGIQFRLADFDPQGNPTNGIERVTNSTWFNDSGSFKSSLVWDPDHYLNIYSNTAGGALGYSTFPQTTAGQSSDGVVLYWASIGRDAPLDNYDQGRTATHEIGHYLGLFHTFQDGCGSSNAPYSTGDLIADTVAESQPNYGCTAGSSPCGGGAKPIDNYMDYSYDTCMDNFSAEQVNRMRCSLMNYRPNLFAVVDGNLAPQASFITDIDGLDVQFTDTSTDDGAVVAWSWEFGDGQTSTTANPVHTYGTSGTFQVILTVTDDAGGTDSYTQNVITNAPPNAAFDMAANELEVAFTDLSTDGNGYVASWSWQFGDGESSTEQNPTHTYAEEGSYDVTLQITDNGGSISSATQNLSVSKADDDDGPVGCLCSMSAPRHTSTTGLAASLLILGLGSLVLVRRRRS